MNKTYKHWLKLPWHAGDKEYNEVLKYMEKYPDAKVEVWLSDTDIFSKYISLTCNQEYNDLDMNVNTGSNMLRRLERKPSNLKFFKINPLEFFQRILD